MPNWLIAEGLCSDDWESIDRACTLARMIDRRRGNDLIGCEADQKVAISQSEQMSIDLAGREVSCTL